MSPAEALRCATANGGAAMDPEARKTAGISNRLLRVSVGIESPEDLCEDLTAGLDRAEIRLSAAAARSSIA